MISPTRRPAFLFRSSFWLVLSALTLHAGEFSTPVSPSPDDWRSYLGEETRSGYSALAQINPGNVTKLEQVWTYRAALPPTVADSGWKGNPLIISGTLYAVAPDGVLVALDVASGVEKWRYGPAVTADPAGPSATAAGLAAWNGGAGQQIFFAVHGRLHAVDAATGRAVAGFGQAGSIDLPMDPAGSGAATLPVTVLGDILVAAGGVRAFDARTGTTRWSRPFPAGPAGVLATDSSRGLLFHASPDGLLGLDGKTGHTVWHQAPAPGHPFIGPAVVFTLHRSGRSLPAVAVATATGRVLLFHRENGEPLVASPDGYAVIPQRDARNRTIAPVVDPENGLYLAASERSLAATHLASQQITWRGHPLTAPAGGGPIVTGGDLVFRGSKEGVQALDANTGAILWSSTLPSSPTGTPATGRTGGRQYLVVPTGEALTAFALPLTEIAKPAVVARPPQRFDEHIGRIEARLREESPAPGGIAFYGSSTFTLWNVAEAFPDLPVTNLGFGGSQITDLNHFADRLLLPLRPRLVVFYCGNNDVSSNHSFDEVVARYRTFAAWMDRNLPDSHVIVLSNLPTPRRWLLWPDLHVLNTRLAAEITRLPRHHYLDGTTIMLDPDGRLRRDRISSDNLHMNTDGNATMRDTLRPVIEALWRKSQ